MSYGSSLPGRNGRGRRREFSVGRGVDGLVPDLRPCRVFAEVVVALPIRRRADGPGMKPPPQLGQTSPRTSRTQVSQNVHSKEQMRASSEAGGREVLQCSQVGRSSNTVRLLFEMQLIPTLVGAAATAPVTAAVGGTRSIAPGFQPGENGASRTSPCSGRQAASLPPATRADTSHSLGPPGWKPGAIDLGRATHAPPEVALHCCPSIGLACSSPVTDTQSRRRVCRDPGLPRGSAMRRAVIHRGR